jgi:hypothetical protein
MDRNRQEELGTPLLTTAHDLCITSLSVSFFVFRDRSASGGNSNITFLKTSLTNRLATSTLSSSKTSGVSMRSRSDAFSSSPSFLS